MLRDGWGKKLAYLRFGQWGTPTESVGHGRKESDAEEHDLWGSKVRKGGGGKYGSSKQGEERKEIKGTRAEGFSCQ